MRCEIVAIGTELLLGQIVDSNSAWIGEQLALAGIDSHFQTKVGDNLERIAAVLRLALARGDAVITCGGLGPTQDDITREALAEVLGTTLARDETVAERIRERFKFRERAMPENNLRQADVPVGARVIPQFPGTAPGLICPVGEKIIYAVPGVPWEMREMMTGTILPDLQRRAGITATIKSRTLRTWGQSESGLAELLAERIRELDRLGNPTLAFLASGIEGIKVRVTAKAADDAAATAMLRAEEEHLRGILGDLVFAIDDETMEAALVKKLRERGLRLSLAETISGGLAAARLNATSGSEKVFRGGLSGGEAALNAMLAVPAGSLLSLDAVKGLALAARRLTGADIGLAISGVAGPEAREEHPPGTVFLGLALGDETEAQRIRLPGRREQIGQFAVISALNWLRLRLD